MIGIDLVPERLERARLNGTTTIDLATTEPDVIAQKMMKTAGLDLTSALFVKQITIRQGQANVKRWADDVVPLATDDTDPLGLESFHTHSLPLGEDLAAYAMFQAKEDGAVKVLLKP